MEGVFISYRRGDCAGQAGRLYDRLVDRLGDGAVFMDIDAIEPGVDFGVRIEQAIGSCTLLIALIGDQWLVIPDASGRPRLENPNDLVRLEIAAALRRDGLRVIPVLVEGAQMPRSDELPDDLKPLARRNAFELSDARWRHDVDRLLDVVQRVAAPAGAARLRAVAGRLSRLPRGRRRAIGAAASVAMLAAALAAGVAFTGSDDGGGAPRAGVAVGPPVTLAGSPERMAVADGAVWVPLGHMVMRVDTGTLAQQPVEGFRDGYAAAAAAGAGKVWVADASSDRVKAIDVGSRAVSRRDTFHVGNEPIDIAVTDRYVWTANCACTDNGKGTVSRIDLSTRRVLREIPVGPYPYGLGVGSDGVVWVTSEDGYVRTIDPDRGEVAPKRIYVGGTPTDVAVDDSGVWVSLSGTNSVVRIDPVMKEVDGRPIRVGLRPWTLAAGGGLIWVAHQGDRSLRWIDETSRRVVGTLFAGAPIPVPEDENLAGDVVAYGGSSAWIASRSTQTLRSVKP